MEVSNLTFSSLDRRAILVSREEEVNEKLLEWLIAVKDKIEEEKLEEIIEVIVTYNSLLIKYKNAVDDFHKEVSRLQSLLASVQSSVKINNRVFHLPVCYNEKFGLDLPMMAKEKQLDLQEFIKLHLAPLYLVHFIGFLPGFPYLGGLFEKLFYARRKTPRKKVLQGAVGIGGHQTGIYPAASPGGWQIIGHCPVRIFDPHKEPPCFFGPGDRIKFYPVSLKEHQAITKEVNAGVFQVKKESYVSESA